MMPATVSLPSNVNSAEPLVAALRNELSWLSCVRPNILLVGDRLSGDAELRDLQTLYRDPVIVWHCGRLPLALPSLELANTLILHDVASLSIGEQQMLSDWLSGESRRPQVVSTSREALYPLVTSGGFLASLYYRLNVIYVDLRASSATLEPDAERR